MSLLSKISFVSFVLFLACFEVMEAARTMKSQSGHKNEQGLTPKADSKDHIALTLYERERFETTYKILGNESRKNNETELILYHELKDAFNKYGFMWPITINKFALITRCNAIGESVDEMELEDQPKKEKSDISADLKKLTKRQVDVFNCMQSYCSERIQRGKALTNKQEKYYNLLNEYYDAENGLWKSGGDFKAHEVQKMVGGQVDSWLKQGNKKKSDVPPADYKMLTLTQIEQFNALKAYGDYVLKTGRQLTDKQNEAYNTVQQYYNPQTCGWQIGAPAPSTVSVAVGKSILNWYNKYKKNKVMNQPTGGGIQKKRHPGHGKSKK